MSLKQTFLTPLLRENPVTFHVLGICPALAITNSLTSSVIMAISVIVVLAISNVSIGLVRRELPSSVRLIVQITIIASAVTVIDQFLMAFMPDAARTLSVYVSLIVTNCLVLGRAEACAMKNGVKVSFVDALGNGVGFGMLLITVATVRELFGNGTLMGYRILDLASEGGWFPASELMLIAPSAFIIIGLLTWLVRSALTGHREEPEFAPLPLPEEEQR